MTAPASKVEAERDAQQPTYANRRLMNDWAEYLAAEYLAAENHQRLGP